MNEHTGSDPLVQAAIWRTRLAQAHGERDREFDAWLAQDPRNAEAWEKVQTPWEVLGEHAASPGLIRLRRRALTHAHEAAREHINRSGRFRLPLTLGSAAALIVLAVASMLIWEAFRFDVYRTRVGERRVVTLADGSQIALDSRSEVRVRYGAHSRELTLVGGQARFDVTHDVTRPFAVTANGEKVIATGTAFNVDLLGPDLLVTLIEGHVVAETPNARITLDPGEQLVISPSAVPRVSRVNVDRAIAWQNGELVFDDEPLASVVTRVSRYGSHPILIRDEQTARLRISGVFHEGDVAGFISTVISYLPVRAQQGSDGSVQLGATGPEIAP